MGAALFALFAVLAVLAVLARHAGRPAPADQRADIRAPASRLIVVALK